MTDDYQEEQAPPVYTWRIHDVTKALVGWTIHMEIKRGDDVVLSTQAALDGDPADQAQVRAACDARLAAYVAEQEAQVAAMADVDAQGLASIIGMEGGEQDG